MTEAYICDAIRTPIGRYGGALSTIRTDDLAAIPLTTLMERNSNADWETVDDVIYGCVNQAGEDNRNVARMGSLLAGLPDTVHEVCEARVRIPMVAGERSMNLAQSCAVTCYEAQRQLQCFQGE